MKGRASTALLCLVAGSAWAACPPVPTDGKLLGARAGAGAGAAGGAGAWPAVQLAWRVDGEPIAGGRHFALVL